LSNWPVVQAVQGVVVVVVLGAGDEPGQGGGAVLRQGEVLGVPTSAADAVGVITRPAARSPRNPPAATSSRVSSPPLAQWEYLRGVSLSETVLQECNEPGDPPPVDRAADEFTLPTPTGGYP